MLGALSVAAASGLPRAASAQQKLVLKTSDVHPAGYPTVVAVENLGKKLDQATNGRLSVQMFAAMQLGGEKEAIEQAQIGALAMARVSVGALGPVVDALNVFNLPFLFRNTAHMQKVIDGAIGQELLDDVTNDPKAGLVGLCWMDAGARSVYDTKHPIHTIADLKGLNIPSMDEAAKIYCDVTGSAVPDLNWYFAYNLFRLAGITQGIAGRIRDGTAASAKAMESAKRTVPLAQASWEYAEKAGAK